MVLRYYSRYYAEELAYYAEERNEERNAERATNFTAKHLGNTAPKKHLSGGKRLRYFN